jgi:hypothetical protein
MGLVQKLITIAQRAFRVLIDRNDNILDVVVTPAFPAGNTRTSAKAFIHGGFSTF